MTDIDEQTANLKLAVWIIHKKYGHLLNKDEFDDIMQDCYVVMERVLREKYDPTRGSIVTYLCRCFKTVAKDYIHRRHIEKRGLEIYAQRNPYKVSDNHRRVHPFNHIESDDEVTARYRKALDSLTPYQRKVLKMLMKGLDGRQIAKKLKVSWQSVYKSREYIRKKFVREFPELRKMLPN